VEGEGRKRRGGLPIAKGEGACSSYQQKNLTSNYSRRRSEKRCRMARWQNLCDKAKIKMMKSHLDELLALLKGRNTSAGKIRVRIKKEAVQGYRSAVNGSSPTEGLGKAERASLQRPATSLGYSDHSESTSTFRCDGKLELGPYFTGREKGKGGGDTSQGRGRKGLIGIRNRL